MARAAILRVEWGKFRDPKILRLFALKFNANISRVRRRSCTCAARAGFAATLRGPCDHARCCAMARTAIFRVEWGKFRDPKNLRIFALKFNAKSSRVRRRSCTCAARADVGPRPGGHGCAGLRRRRRATPAQPPRNPAQGSAQGPAQGTAQGPQVYFFCRIL